MRVLNSQRSLDRFAQPEGVQARDDRQSSSLSHPLHQVAAARRLLAGQVLRRWRIRVANRNGKFGQSGARPISRGHLKRSG